MAEPTAVTERRPAHALEPFVRDLAKGAAGAPDEHCARGAINDVAIATPPGREPILIAADLSEGNSERAAAIHAEVGRLVASEL